MHFKNTAENIIKTNDDNLLDINQVQYRQKYLGQKGLIAFIALLNMFVPISTDLYLPALPSMSKYFSVSATLVNLTLVAFFLFYAVGLLFWGPLSEKYGRKRILLYGMAIYVLSSFACAGATNIYWLIIFRVLQAMGSGAIVSVSTAVVKDCFSGKARSKVLAMIQSMMLIAPMSAPILGAFILRFTTWRGSFIALAMIGLASLIMGLFFQETLARQQRYNGSLLGSLSRLAVVAKNKSFSMMLLTFAFLSVGFMGYIAISSYIYIDYFHLNSQQYSYFFAANSCSAMLGPFIYLRTMHKITAVRFSLAGFIITLVSGMLLMTVGSHMPFLFFLSFVPFAVTTSAIRPFSTNLLLDQQKGDTGSAASLINFTNTIAGSIGMLVASMAWSNLVEGLGLICALSAVASIIGWLVMRKLQIVM
ncbi:MAG: multidrug effflux MFS transporter [Bacillota bacterium]|jgi:DHA1 family bicyclomycin/chloramphenicol resistance-like MFS transporter